MPAWKQAQHAAKTSLNQQLASRRSDKELTPIFNSEMVKKRFEQQRCIYCGGQKRRRVCHLPLSGDVVVCAEHWDEYLEDKAWEINELGDSNG